MQTPNKEPYDIRIDSIEDAVFIYNTNSGAIVEANDAMLSMYGYTREQMEKLTVDDLGADASPLDRRAAMQGDGVAPDYGPQPFQWRARKMSGEPFWVEISLSHAPGGHRHCILAVVRDITRRKHSELLYRKIRAQNEAAKFTLNRVNIAVFWCRADGFFFHVNGTASRWLQYGRDELLKMHVADINPELSRQAWKNHWRGIKKRGRLKITSVHRRKNRETYPVEIYLNYLKVGGKEYKLALVHDISARRKAEQEKQALEDRLRQAQKMEAIGTLAGGVAHDLNNMLSPILGYAELLNDEMKTDRQSRTRLGQIYEACLRARNLTRQILAFGRKQPLSMGPLDLNDVIVGFEKMLHHLVRENIVIEKRLAPSLPVIEGDVGRIEQIILNLAVNAQDAMPDGGTLCIETRATYLDETFPDFGSDVKAGRYVVMAVSDTGGGMDEGTRSRILEPFFTTKERGQGTGLGLSSVDSIVKLHGGYLWTYSKAGYGTTIKVFLPQSEDPPRNPIRDIPAMTAAQGRETILVVEDQAQVMLLAKHILERSGYTVLAADTVAAAIDIANRSGSGIALLLTDVVMPGLNGRALYEKLAERLPDLKVLYMSGYTGAVIGHQGIMEEGANFISKPFGVRDLLSGIRDVLGR